MVQLNCEVIVPDHKTPTQTYVERWSKIDLHEPALVVVPDSEEDVIDAIFLAKQNGLILMAAGGGTSPAVPLNSKTLYLNLKKLNDVILDRDAETIKFGGGALTGQVVETCTSQGFYTTWANSNVVGMTGSILGGGNSPFNGLHGLIMDQVLCVRIITAGGEKLEVGPSSKGEELSLFNAICGAGQGLGVIVSTTMKVFPLSSLGMDGDKVWTRRVIFPAGEIELAASTYVRMQPQDPNFVTVLMFMRNPSDSPAPGCPVIMIAASYYGPHKKAEEAASVLFEKDLVGRAIQAVTVTSSLARVNDAMAPLSGRGDYKDIASAWLRTSANSSFQSAFNEWITFTDKYQDAKRCMVVHAAHNPQRSVLIAQQRPERSGYFDARERGNCLLLFSWATKLQTVDPMRAFAKKVKAIYRQDQVDESPRTFANNLQFDTKLDEIYTNTQIEELKRVRSRWDNDGLFWSPIGDKRHSP
ncbi:FAD-binding domain-containing protein [Myriangium duriaei CBS 260.36]|uniref:FAD-binding domain-containing protein n=1 Tax=Myriangium duriaei CBS 260.36 TaxID=1168546 RepID=A0A9P4MES8_9PEZI|nr:FAD-binding domain-containing protein [Myriangium duriaei CBS 260.36]